MALLEKLTPQGSEFCGDPGACYTYALKVRAHHFGVIKRLIIENRKLRSLLTNQTVNHEGSINKDGSINKACCICGVVIPERDMEQYYETNGNRIIECCTNCREEFEVDNTLSLESDIPKSYIFDSFWAFALEGKKYQNQEKKESVQCVSLNRL